MNPPSINDGDLEKETVALLGQLKAEPSATARERAFAKLATEFHATAAPTRASSATRRWAVAAAVLVVLAGGMAWRALQPVTTVASLESLDGTLVAHGAHWFDADSKPAVGQSLAAGAMVTVSNDGGALLRLSPDLTVRLAAGTRARLTAVDEIELAEGRVFVDATPGTHSALRIVTPRGVVSHLGTQYLVRWEHNEMEVSVREGSALLALGSLKATAVAGEWVTHRASGELVTGTLPENDPRFEWIGALPSDFKLDGATLTQFLGWFHRETGLVPIYAEGLDGGHLGQVQLKGSIENLDTLEALSLVLATADLAWHRDGAKVIIEQRSAKAG